jgi:hypothetical protein
MNQKYKGLENYRHGMNPDYDRMVAAGARQLPEDEMKAKYQRESLLAANTIQSHRDRQPPPTLTLPPHSKAGAVAMLVVLAVLLAIAWLTSRG